MSNPIPCLGILMNHKHPPTLAVIFALFFDRQFKKLRDVTTNLKLFEAKNE